MSVQWTGEEQLLLKQLWNERKSDAEIAREITELGTLRTAGAVECFRKKFELRRTDVCGRAKADREHPLIEEIDTSDVTSAEAQNAAFVAAMVAAGYPLGSTPWGGCDAAHIQRLVPVRGSRHVEILGSGWQV